MNALWISKYGQVKMKLMPDGQVYCFACKRYYTNPIDAYLNLCDHEEEGHSLDADAFLKLDSIIQRRESYDN